MVRNLSYLSLSSGNGLVHSFGCRFIYSGHVSNPFCIKKPRAYSTFVLRGSIGSLCKDERYEPFFFFLSFFQTYESFRFFSNLILNIAARTTNSALILGGEGQKNKLCLVASGKRVSFLFPEGGTPASCWGVVLSSLAWGTGFPGWSLPVYRLWGLSPSVQFSSITIPPLAEV